MSFTQFTRPALLCLLSIPREPPPGTLRCVSLRLAFLGAHASSTEETVSPDSDKEAEDSSGLGPRLLPSRQHMSTYCVSGSPLGTGDTTKTDERPCHDGVLPPNWMDKQMINKYTPPG